MTLMLRSMMTAVAFASTWGGCIAVARCEDKKTDEPKVPAISLPFPPLFPFQQKPKPVSALNKIFASAKAGTTVECDFTFSGSGIGTGASAYGKFDVKKGTATLYTERGSVKYLPYGKDVTPGPDKKEMKFGFIDGRCGFEFERGKPPTSWMVMDSNIAPEDYLTLPMPVRKDGNEWKVRLKVVLSSDYEGSITWWVDLQGK